MSRKQEQGYLLIVAVILIAIVSIAGSFMAHMFVSETRSTTNIFQSNTAFYIATSGLEAAKRDIVANKMECLAINSAQYAGSPKYVNACYPQGATSCVGYFTVQTNKTSASSALSGAITAMATSIPLASAQGFAAFGAAVIGSEVIAYSGIQGNTLLNVARGTNNTVASSHASGASVSQNMCTLTSRGDVPGIDPIEGSRTVRQHLLITEGNGYLAPGQTLPGGIMPAVIIGNTLNDSVFAQGSLSIINENMSGLGCAVATQGEYKQQGNGPDYTCKAGGDQTKPIWASNYNPPPPAINQPPLFYDYFFNQSVTAMEDIGYHALTTGNINDVITNGYDIVWIEGTGVGHDNRTVTLRGNYLTNASTVKTLIIEGNLIVGTGTTIGGSCESGGMPVKIIVTGNFTQTGNGTINGFLYVMGTTTITQTSSFVINGALASVDKAALKNCTINFSSCIYDKLDPAGVIGQVSNPEVFN